MNYIPDYPDHPTGEAKKPLGDSPSAWVVAIVDAPASCVVDMACDPTTSCGTRAEAEADRQTLYEDEPGADWRIYEVAFQVKEVQP